MKTLTILLCVVITRVTWAGPVITTNVTSLKGVTIPSTPFVLHDNGKFFGYSVDLIEFISKEVGFNYELYPSPDGKYGTRNQDGTWTGMIGEVLSGKAAFAIADLTITEERSEVVDFTIPYHDLELAALVHVNHSTGLTNLKDLAQLNNGPSVGVLANGASYDFLTKSNQETAKKLIRKIEADKNNLVKSVFDGYDRVQNGESFALVGESSRLQYYAGNLRALVFLPDEEKMFPRFYGIALPKGSPMLGKFNEAIKKWREKQAKYDYQQYWRSPGDF